MLGDPILAKELVEREKKIDIRKRNNKIEKMKMNEIELRLQQ